jgi:S-adenosylmethionine synthetase
VKENFDFRLGMMTINLKLNRDCIMFLKIATYKYFEKDDPNFTYEVVKPLKYEKSLKSYLSYHYCLIFVLLVLDE